MAPVLVWLSVQCSGFVAASGLVVYAGHCSEDVDWVEISGHGILLPDRCEKHPDARPGSPKDIAFCLVETFELADSHWAGPEVNGQGDVVGLGFGGPGARRAAARSFHGLVLGHTTYGMVVVSVASYEFCGGDSGGPLLDAGGRVVGIASGAEDECNAVEVRPRRAYYAPLAGNVEWLESQSGIRLSVQIAEVGLDRVTEPGHP